MRQSVILFCTLALVFLGAGEIFAGSVDYLSNQSIEYVRTLTRNAATDAADAINYNPAGVAKMKDGLYLNLGNQYLIKDYKQEDQDATHTYNTKVYESTTPTQLLPYFYAVYKKDNWAAFAAFTVPAGGGKLEFDGGTPMVRTKLNPISMLIPGGVLSNIDELSISSMYYAGTLGGAYAINDMISVSLGCRYISAKKKYTLDAKTPDSRYTDGTTIADVKLASSGFGGIIGVDITPVKELNIGMRYETVTKLEWDVTVDGSQDTTLLGSPFVDVVVNGLGYADGEKEKKDLPALLALGAEYKITPELSAACAFVYYFIKQATWKHYNGDKANKEYDNGYEASIGFVYKIMPELEASIGYLYTSTGGNKKTWSDLDMSLDCNTIGLGCKYTVIPNLNINFGTGWAKYKDSENEDKVKYSKDNKLIGLSVEYKAL